MVRGRKFACMRWIFYRGECFADFDQASSHVQWLVIRNNSSFLQKRKLGTLTTVCRLKYPTLHGFWFQEPNNLKNRNNFRFNGLIHPKVVGVESIANGKGVQLNTGSVKSRIVCLSSLCNNTFDCLDISKPAKRFHKAKLTKDSRRTLTSIRRTIRKQRYRKDLKMVRCHCFIAKSNTKPISFI